MLNLYDDIPDQYSMQKMIYDDKITLQDLIDKMKKPEKPKNDAKPYDYNDNALAPMVKDEIIGGNQTTGVAPEPSETIKGGSMGLKIENKNSQKNQVSMPPSPLHDDVSGRSAPLPDVHDDVCVDTGATEDVLGRDRGVRANNKQDSNDILIGMGGEVKINQVGDYKFTGGLMTEQGLINSKSYMTCISVPDRTDKDWLFWADRDTAQLIAPDNDKYDFTKTDGLYKLNKDQTVHKDIPNRLMDNKDTDTDHLTQSWVSKSKDKKNIKRDKLSAKHWMMMIMLSYMLGMPGMMTAPGLYDLLSDYKDKDEVITENNNKPKPAKTDHDTLYEHACKGHPHDPLCPACVRARLTAKANTKNDEDMIIKGSDDGAVMGIDYIGPYIKDVDGNVMVQ